MEQNSIPTFISGSLLDLHPMALENLDVYYRWINDTRVRRYGRRGFPQSRLQYKQQLEENLRSPTWVGLELIHKGDQKPIGMITFNRMSWVTRWAVVGLRIDPSYWHQGMGSEAGRLLIQYAFKELHLHKLSANILDANWRSYKTAEKLGFQLEGTLKDEVFIEGHYQNTRTYALFNPDDKQISRYSPDNVNLEENPIIFHNVSLPQSVAETPPTTTPFLEDDSLEFHPYVSEHCSMYITWLNQDGNRQLEQQLLPENPDLWKKRIESALDHQTMLFLEIWKKNPLHFMGFVILENISWIDRRALMRVTFSSLADWNDPISLKILRMIITYGFSELNLHKIGYLVIAPHKILHSHLISLGFQHELTYQDDGLYHGQYCENLRYSIFNSE